MGKKNVKVTLGDKQGKKEEKRVKQRVLLGKEIFIKKWFLEFWFIKF